jgi:hypothetical protein
MILLILYWIRKSSKLLILLLDLVLNPVLALSQFGNLEFIFVKDFRFQTCVFGNYKSWKKHFAQKRKNFDFDCFISLV